MLRKLKPLHHEVIRRLVVGEKPPEISVEMGMHVSTITRWMNKEPVFVQELNAVLKRATDGLINSAERKDALQIILDANADAAQLCVDVMKDEDVSKNLRLKSAWDILDRTDVGKKDESPLEDLALLIIEAAKLKEKQDKEDEAIVIEVESGQQGKSDSNLPALSN